MFLHIFNLSWSRHSFLSIWKSSFVISIHKTGNFWTHLLLSRLLLSLPASQGYLSASFYLVYPSIMEFNYILSLSLQAGFCSDRSILEQILYPSLFVSDGCSRNILSAIDLFKAFDSVRHPPLFHKHISWPPS